MKHKAGVKLKCCMGSDEGEMMMEVVSPVDKEGGSNDRQSTHTKMGVEGVASTNQ